MTAVPLPVLDAFCLMIHTLALTVVSIDSSDLTATVQSLAFLACTLTTHLTHVLSAIQTARHVKAEDQATVSLVHRACIYPMTHSVLRSVHLTLTLTAHLASDATRAV